LTHAADNLTNVSINTSASRSRILDVEYAKAASELARTQIIQQAATAILAQANASQQTIMKLLQ
jgi:flagellin